MHELKTGLDAEKLLLFGHFQKAFITHSFFNRPLYTLQPAKRK